MKDLCRRAGRSKASYYLWRSKLQGYASDARRLKAHTTENEVTKEAHEKNEWLRRRSGVGAVDGDGGGLSERLLGLLGMSASTLWWEPQVIRADNGPECAGQAMRACAHRQEIELRMIEPGELNRNA